MGEKENTCKRLKAGCTWGDGPDVMLVNEGKGYVLHEKVVWRNRFTHGVSFEGSMDLTAKEAEILAMELLEVARQVRELEEAYEEGMRKHG